ALQMLRDRFTRFRVQDSGPGRNLAEALDQVFQAREAWDVLRSALEARPQDGDLLLHASSFLSRLGQNKKASKLLHKAKGNCHEADWLAAAARHAQLDGRLEDSVALLQKSLVRAPLHLGTHRHAV